ncbi:MAG TPA: 3'-5' exonuclease [Nitriliruptoraceae bacterium]|nr:3'-5' exonuclease [Nitriliruptoraceae bacterium]
MVDVETSGPSPAEHALLSLGACVVFRPEQRFSVEVRPERDGVDPRAVAVSGLSLQRLAREGVPEGEAMRAFAQWVEDTTAGVRPVFVAHNAPFDWMFVAEALHRHLGRNPFGHSALDTKALFMGMAGVDWPATSLDDLAAHVGVTVSLPHDALADALLQAEVLRALLGDPVQRPAPSGSMDT